MKLLAILSLGLAVFPILPGTSVTNQDNVRVSVRLSSPAVAHLTPLLGAGLSSVVRFDAGCKGSATGLDWFDSVHVAAGAKAYIEGSPWKVVLETGCVARVANYYVPPPPGVGSGLIPSPILVVLPQGATSTVVPGTEHTFAP